MRIRTLTPDDEVALLRRFEPVIRYTRGELFFPMDVDPYVRASSLWMQRPDQEAKLLVPQGELTLEKLAIPRLDTFNTVFFLRFIEPLDLINLLEYLRTQRKKRNRRGVFRSGYGRLARVGFSSRFAGLLFSLSLLMRGRVPGDASAAAAMEYERLLSNDQRYCYYGRVIPTQDWIVLQYWFFYAFNNWRSGFFGVNDHEGDWEMINIYLYESPDGSVTPEWVAYSSHDFSGDDLRRRWDDPELEKVGEHPVIYAAAGSHACYYLPGEYQTEIVLPFLSPLARLAAWANTFGRRLLGQGDAPQESAQSGLNVMRIPFVDYARGDGFSIGPGQDQEWDAPRLLNPLPGWVVHYPGLWGFFARDPISGENAPAGPMYNRDGTIRRAWYDPLGWAGLDKCPPPNRALERLRQEQAEVQLRYSEIQKQIEAKGEELANWGVISAALRGQAHLKALDDDLQKQLRALSGELDSLRAQLAKDERLLDALRLYETRLLAGEHEPARAHIQRAPRPVSESELRMSRLVEFWSAVSISLMMIGFVGLALFYRQHLILGLVALISIFTFIESGFRKQLPKLINSLALGLAIVSLLIILFDFFWYIIILLVLFAGIYILWENLREFLAG